jgi:hypothetical protein
VGRIANIVTEFARRLWSVVGPLLTASAICLVVAYVFFGLTSFSVTNESGRDLKSVTLQRYSIEGDRGIIWTEDLDGGESEWRYTYPGDYGVLLRFVLDGKEVRYECRYDSGGASRAIEFKIDPDGTVSCWYE